MTALHALLDPEHPALLAALTRVDERRRPALPVRRRIAPLVPTRRLRVAVVVPLYDYEQYVEQAIRSAAGQQGVDVRVVVVDDCSTDGSHEVATRVAAQVPGVTVLRNATNRGPGETFNRGWQAVESDLVVRLDPDDLLTPGSLARSAAVLDADPAVGLVYGRVRHFEGASPAPQIVPHAGPASAVVWSGQDWVRHEIAEDRNVIATPEAAVRTSLMREHGGWKPALRHSQDHEMWLRAATLADVAYVHGPDQALKRDHAASLSATERDLGIVDLEQRRDSYDAWFADVGHRLPDADRLRAEQQQAIAGRAVATAAHRYRRGLGPTGTTAELEAFAEALVPGSTARLTRLRAVDARLGRATRWLPSSVLAAAGYRARETAVVARHRRTGL